ncbi:hypothetical protein BVI434_610003 [Burkholderia vietnamiensis]|nr:hypothetical protein BVI434_610003 [Burkholderia vietnamiensis]
MRLATNLLSGNLICKVEWKRLGTNP